MTNGKRWTATLCLGLMTLLGGSRLWAADLKKQQAEEVRGKMKAEGWTEIVEGVFERRIGPNKVEHLGYGRTGLAWIIGDQTLRLENLMREYETYPSEDLSKTIDSLSVSLSRMKSQLRKMPEGMSGLTANVTGPSCSSICYKATADAYPLTSTQGVGAVADSSFSSSCGYSGDTAAYAYSRATLNGTTTTVTQSDPHTGTSVTSHAAASVNGGSASGIACYSEASASATSNSLGISYSTSDTNYDCPAQNCSVSISGTTYEYFTSTVCRSRSWTATPSSCSTPTTYQWYKNGVAISGATSSTYTQNVCYNSVAFTLKVLVNGTTWSANHTVTAEYEAPEPPCNPICP
jgi:hypothetical protein